MLKYIYTNEERCFVFMSKHDLEFEKYLCKRNFIDIMNVFYHLDNIPHDIDDDILESIYDVAKSSREEFLEAIRMYDFPKEDLEIVNKRYREVISKIEKSGLPALVPNSFDKRFEDGTSEISKEDFYKWYNYYQKWLNASDEEYEKHLESSKEKSVENGSSSLQESDEESKILFALEHDRFEQKSGEKIKNTIRNYLSGLYSSNYYRSVDISYLRDSSSRRTK